jgi:hypothetical protein
VIFDHQEMLRTPAPRGYVRQYIYIGRSWANQAASVPYTSGSGRRSSRYWASPDMYRLGTCYVWICRMAAAPPLPLIGGQFGTAIMLKPHQPSLAKRRRTRLAFWQLDISHKYSDLHSS